ncbi:MAG: putative 4-hydroxybenzoate polyprenyltransferase [Actinobacteria bacterium]|nr:putative 4-hydroxybenzoate polyprenyltransferase [Actinomycetota bacterium]MCL5888225.1 putative 4-hydroxybenzoate polyprenyltransferase [Actinomycetota bacterium]
MKSALAKARIFLELIKFEHSVFALPYAYIGAIYGAGASWPTLAQLFWITVVMVSARAFAFLLNRFVDRHIDARNPRTATRAIPAGSIGTREVVLFGIVALVLYFLGIWQLDPLARMLWPIPLIAFIVYPYTKRFTPLCHYWLGMCLGLAPVGGWVAVGGDIADPAPWVIGAAVMLWTAGFDIIYATQDVQCDRRDGVRSMPADLGIGPALLQTRIAHASTVLLLVLGGMLLDAGAPWYIGVAASAALLAYENSIVTASDLSRVDAAFFTVNGVIAILVGVGAIADRLL